MRALERCDFCEDGPARVYEVVPPELEPTPSEQRRVALCEGCRVRLEGLLEPLLDRLEAGSAGDSGAGNEGDPNDGDGNAPAGNDGGDGNATGTGNAPAGNDDGSGIDDDAAVRATAAEEASKRGPATGSGRDGVTVGGGSTGDGTADARGTSDDGAGGDRPPRAYGKLLRLLRNREFPMDRDDVEGLAAGAYDLEREEVEAIVDHAIERGELIEDGRQLRRG